MENLSEDRNWQSRLLPLMSFMVLGLTVFFMVVSLLQLSNLQSEIGKRPVTDVTLAFSDVGEAPDFTEAKELARLKAVVSLEAIAMEHRHHQANVLLMARVWTRYLGFVTGMILAMVGAVFTLGKLRAPKTEINANASDTGFIIKSASPGLIMTTLGVGLMVVNIAVNHTIKVNDRAVFNRLLSPTAVGSSDPSMKNTDLSVKPELPDREAITRRLKELSKGN